MRDVPVSALVPLYIRLTAGRRSDFSFLANFTPIYSSALSILSNSTLEKRQKIRGTLTSPEDVVGIRVAGSRFGRAKRIQYNPRTGKFSFTHARKGRAPRKSRFRSVTYTDDAYQGGSVIGITSKQFRVRY